VDAARLLPHIPQSQFPAQALSVALYVEGGVRVSEIGSVMLAHPDPATGEMIYPALDLARFAIPRRVYTDTHLRYVAEVLEAVRDRKDGIKGLRITHAAKILRHFTARFAEVG
jgi:tryptophanase